MKPKVKKYIDIILNYVLNLNLDEIRYLYE